MFFSFFSLDQGPFKQHYSVVSRHQEVGVGLSLDVHIVHEVALTAHSVARFRDPAAGALLAN